MRGRIPLQRLCIRGLLLFRPFIYPLVRRALQGNDIDDIFAGYNAIGHAVIKVACYSKKPPSLSSASS